MKVLHAFFQAAPVGPELVVASLQDGLTADVYALAHFIVYDAGLYVPGLLRVDEVAPESGDLFRVIKLQLALGFARQRLSLFFLKRVVLAHFWHRSGCERRSAQ